MSAITDNDKYVLNAIFNPNYPLDFDQKPASDSTDSEDESENFQISKSTENFFLSYFLRTTISN